MAIINLFKKYYTLTNHNRLVSLIGFIGGGIWINIILYNNDIPKYFYIVPIIFYILGLMTFIVAEDLTHLGENKIY